jgi:hypothetical protein
MAGFTKLMNSLPESSVWCEYRKETQSQSQTDRNCRPPSDHSRIRRIHGHAGFNDQELDLEAHHPKLSDRAFSTHTQERPRKGHKRRVRTRSAGGVSPNEQSNRKVGLPGLVGEKQIGTERISTPVRLLRSLTRVPVVDLDENRLYEVDKQTAKEHLSSGRALVVNGCAIRMRIAGMSGKQQLSAGSLECSETSVVVMRKLTTEPDWRFYLTGQREVS